MKFLPILFFTSLIFLPFCLTAQTTSGLNAEWVKSHVGPGFTASYETASDNDKNLYQSITFSDSLYIESTLFTSSGTGNNVVVKLTPDGNKVWATHLSANSIWIDKIHYGKDNFLYFIGSFKDTLNFREADGTPNYFYSANNVNSAFWAKLDTAGNLIYFKNEGNSDEAYGIDISATAGGEVFICGRFDTTLSTQQGSKPWIARYNSSGNKIFEKFYDVNTTYAFASSFTLDDSLNMYVVGSFQGKMKFSDTDSIELPNAYNSRFIAKIDGNGDKLWAKIFYTWDIYWTLPENPIISDDQSKVRLFGRFASDSMRIDPLGQDILMVISGDISLGYTEDHFFTEFDAQTGNITSYAQSNSPKNDNIAYVNSRQGKIYAVNISDSIFDVDLSANVYNAAPNSILVYNEADMSLEEVYTLPSSTSGEIYFNGYEIFSPSEVYTIGSFSNTTNFDTLNSSPLVANGDYDAFTVKYTTQPLSISYNDFDSKTDFNTYPNPTTDIINISSEYEISAVEMYNLSGQMILARQINSNIYQLDISSLNAGVYFVKAKFTNGAEYAKRIVVK